MKITHSVQSKVTQYALAAFICISVIGCKTVNSVGPGVPVANKLIITDKRVITDPTLGKRAQILAVNETSTPGGFAKVQVELLNNANKMKHIEYLFEWFDADGNLIPSSTRAYQVKELLGKESIYLNSIAPTTNAKDFRLKLTRASR